MLNTSTGNLTGKPLASTSENTKTKIPTFNNRLNIPDNHFFDNTANTMPNSESIPRMIIAIIKFALGTLIIKNAVILAITIKKDRNPK